VTIYARTLSAVVVLDRICSLPSIDKALSRSLRIVVSGVPIDRSYRSHFKLSDLTQISRSAAGSGSFRYKSAITKHFAIVAGERLTETEQISSTTTYLHTQVRQHAPENSKSGGWLLVELEEDSSGKAFEIVKRTRRGGRHLAFEGEF
jgi:hypothetical protein